jgi:putative ABC transport system ATP-binding protein
MSIVVRFLRKILHARISPGEPSLVLELPSLEIPSGSFAAVMGPSGCGKSLLMGIMAGIIPADEGEIVLADHALDLRQSALNEAFRLRSIGILLQGRNLLESLTVFENVALGLRFSRTYPRLQWRTRSMEMLARVGLAHLAREWPSRLSPAQRQKVSLARSLVHHPRVVLLDEPTARLDPASAAQMIQLAIETTREGGQTLVLFTDDPAIAGRFETRFDASHLLVRSDFPS